MYSVVVLSYLVVQCSSGKSEGGTLDQTFLPHNVQMLRPEAQQVPKTPDHILVIAWPQRCFHLKSLVSEAYKSVFFMVLTGLKESQVRF